MLVAEDTYNEGEDAVVRQGRSIALVVAFLIGCAVLLTVGCARTRLDTPQEGQGHTEASTKEQTRSPEATASEEEPRCQGTRTIKRYGVSYGTNDVPGCPKGGLLLGTDKIDNLDGRDGDDEIRGFGGRDSLYGGPGNDILYGGPGSEYFLSGGKGDDVIHAGDGKEDFLIGGPGEDVIYGGDGNDILNGYDGQRDKLYCGKGNNDGYLADKNDYVDGSCEKKLPSNYFVA